MAGAMGSASRACHQAAGAEHSVHTLWIRAWFNTAWIGRLQKSHFQNTQGSLQGNSWQKLEHDKEHPMTVPFIMLLSKKIVENSATNRNPTRAWWAFQNIFRHHTVTKIPFAQETLQQYYSRLLFYSLEYCSVWGISNRLQPPLNSRVWTRQTWGLARRET